MTEEPRDVDELIHELEEDPPEKYEYPDKSSDSSVLVNTKGKSFAFWITVFNFLIFLTALSVISPLYKSMYDTRYTDLSSDKVPFLSRALINLSHSIFPYGIPVLAIIAAVVIVVGLRFKKFLAVKDFLYISFFFWIIFCIMTILLLIPLQA